LKTFVLDRESLRGNQRAARLGQKKDKREKEQKKKKKEAEQYIMKGLA